MPSARSGSFEPKHSPLAVDTPTRSPVYEPGPILTHTASHLSTVSPFSSSMSLINGAVSEACMRLALLSLYEIMFSLSASATEQRSVEVSISMIFI